MWHSIFGPLLGDGDNNERSQLSAIVVSTSSNITRGVNILSSSLSTVFTAPMPQLSSLEPWRHPTAWSDGNISNVITEEPKVSQTIITGNVALRNLENSSQRYSQPGFNQQQSQIRDVTVSQPMLVLNMSSSSGGVWRPWNDTAGQTWSQPGTHVSCPTWCHTNSLSVTSQSIVTWSHAGKVSTLCVGNIVQPRGTDFHQNNVADATWSLSTAPALPGTWPSTAGPVSSSTRSHERRPTRPYTSTNGQFIAGRRSVFLSGGTTVPSVSGVPVILPAAAVPIPDKPRMMAHPTASFQPGIILDNNSFSTQLLPANLRSSKESSAPGNFPTYRRMIGNTREGCVNTAPSLYPSYQCRQVASDYQNPIQIVGEGINKKLSVGPVSRGVPVSRATRRKRQSVLGLIPSFSDDHVPHSNATMRDNFPGGAGVGEYLRYLATESTIDREKQYLNQLIKIAEEKSQSKLSQRSVKPRRTKKDNKCIIPGCEKSHPLWMCPIFRSADVDRKWSYTYDLKVCHLCLSVHVGYTRCKIPSNTCHHCLGDHSSLLCYSYYLTKSVCSPETPDIVVVKDTSDDEERTFTIHLDPEHIAKVCKLSDSDDVDEDDPKEEDKTGQMSKDSAVSTNVPGPECSVQAENEKKGKKLQKIKIYKLNQQDWQIMPSHDNCEGTYLYFITHIARAKLAEIYSLQIYSLTVFYNRFVGAQSDFSSQLERLSLSLVVNLNRNIILCETILSVVNYSVEQYHCNIMTKVKRERSYTGQPYVPYQPPHRRRPEGHREGRRLPISDCWSNSEYLRNPARPRESRIRGAMMREPNPPSRLTRIRINPYYSPRYIDRSDYHRRYDDDSDSSDDSGGPDSKPCLLRRHGYCNAKHPQENLYKCEFFSSLLLESRWEILRRYSLCPYHLRPHYSGYCETEGDQGQCEHCKGFHMYLLCHRIEQFGKMDIRHIDAGRARVSRHYDDNERFEYGSSGQRHQRTRRGKTTFYASSSRVERDKRYDRSSRNSSTHHSSSIKKEKRDERSSMKKEKRGEGRSRNSSTHHFSSVKQEKRAAKRSAASSSQSSSSCESSSSSVIEIKTNVKCENDIVENEKTYPQVSTVSTADNENVDITNKVTMKRSSRDPRLRMMQTLSTVPIAPVTVPVAITPDAPVPITPDAPVAVAPVASSVDPVTDAVPVVLERNWELNMWPDNDLPQRLEQHRMLINHLTNLPRISVRTTVDLCGEKAGTINFLNVRNVMSDAKYTECQSTQRASRVASCNCVVCGAEYNTLNNSALTLREGLTIPGPPEDIGDEIDQSIRDLMEAGTSSVDDVISDQVDDVISGQVDDVVTVQVDGVVTDSVNDGTTDKEDITPDIADDTNVVIADTAVADKVDDVADKADDVADVADDTGAVIADTAGVVTAVATDYSSDDLRAVFDTDYSDTESDTSEKGESQGDLATSGARSDHTAVSTPGRADSVDNIITSTTEVPVSELRIVSIESTSINSLST